MLTLFKERDDSPKDKKVNKYQHFIKWHKNRAINQILNQSFRKIIYYYILC